MIRYLSIILLFFSSSVFAVDYYWSNYQGGIRHSSPTACVNANLPVTYPYYLADPVFNYSVNPPSFRMSRYYTGNPLPNGGFTCFRYGDSCPQYHTFNQSTGTCLRTSCPSGQDFISGNCFPSCPDGLGRDSNNQCISIVDLCDSTSPNFNLDQCIALDAPCPDGNQIILNGQKTCVEEPQPQDECSPAASGYIGTINGVPYCNPENRCPSGQEFGIVNGKQVCVPNQFAPPECSPPEVLTSGGCMVADSPYNPDTQNPSVTNDNNATGSSTPDPTGSNVTVHTGAGAAQGQNGEQAGTGQCDPTKPNYAICVGQTQTADSDPLDAVLKKTDKEGSGYLNTYFDKADKSLDDNSGLNPSTTGPTGITNIVKNVVPQYSACSQFQISFPNINLVFDCDKFNKFKQWFGWFLWITTVFYIVMLALTPFKSEV